MKLLSRMFNDAPEKASRPMSATAGGFVPASGAGILLLESLSTARARGARIYAEVLARLRELRRAAQWAGACRRRTPRACAAASARAVAMAGIRSEEIDAINGHLTATFADPHEVESWSVALGLPPSKMPLIQATKSLIGHALGAAGGIECVAAVLELDARLRARVDQLRGSASGAGRVRRPHPTRTVALPDLKIIAKASFGSATSTPASSFVSSRTE